MAVIGSKAELLALQKKFVTDAAIGMQFSITRQAVHQLRNKYGISSVAERNAQRNKDICVAYKKGTPVPEIVRKAHVSISQIYRIIKRGK